MVEQAAAKKTYLEGANDQFKNMIGKLAEAQRLQAARDTPSHCNTHIHSTRHSSGKQHAEIAVARDAKFREHNIK